MGYSTLLWNYLSSWFHSSLLAILLAIRSALQSRFLLLPFLKRRFLPNTPAPSQTAEAGHLLRYPTGSTSSPLAAMKSSALSESSKLEFAMHRLEHALFEFDAHKTQAQQVGVPPDLPPGAGVLGRRVCTPGTAAVRVIAFYRDRLLDGMPGSTKPAAHSVDYRFCIDRRSDFRS
jgi:hypothetical protein